MLISPVLVLFVTIFLTLASGQDPTGDPLVVRTAKGYLKGSILTSRKGKSIYSFRGVRFAQPPVGNRRFKVRNWNAGGQQCIPCHIKKKRTLTTAITKRHDFISYRHIGMFTITRVLNLRIWRY
jgi:hypothetical protein